LLDGCFSHYTKILWSKARDLGLCKKHLIKETFFFIFLFKIYPYVLNNEKKEYLKKVKEIYKENKLKYSDFIEYFEKNWVNSNFAKFELYDNDSYIFRTNNFVESYHKVLNSIIECYHPKMSYFVLCLGKYIKNKYEDYCLTITQKKKNNL